MNILRFPSFYIAFPFFVSALFAVLIFEFPDGYIDGVYFLLTIVSLIVPMDVFIIRGGGTRKSLPKIGYFDNLRQKRIAVTLAAIVIFFCVIDLSFFKIPLFNDPTSYATFEGGRLHVRHISNMSWILPPIALICLKKGFWRKFLVLFGFIFPILVLDRNRLIATLASLIMVIIFRRKANSPLPWIRVGLSGIVCLAGFSFLGTLRSGLSAFMGITLPFTSFFLESPLAVQWILLYGSAGIYNFSSIFAKDYKDMSFLINQIVPLYGSVETAGSGIPLDADVINIGTEFFPILMALGAVGVIFCLIILYLLLLWSFILVRRKRSIFAVLIFLRMSYVALMAPFAPQAFTWTNFDFIFLCIFLWALSSLPTVKNRFLTKRILTPTSFAT